MLRLSLLMANPAMFAAVNPPHEETDSLLHRGTLTISARMSSPFLFFKARPIPALLSTGYER